jgi:undecaprenol kinase
MIKSFADAFRGLFIAVRNERNLKIHLAAAAVVFTAAGLLKAEPWVWVALVLTCALVIAAELINTAIERICDKLDPNECPFIRDAKDISAGAVLVCSIAAVAVGIIVFWRVVF